ncbi:DUF732 domain-containing protein [Blastococcus sp. SYSU D00820]
MTTQELPPVTWHVPQPAPPTRRRSPWAVVLATLTVLLVAGVGVLGWLVLDARSSARDAAAAEAVEDGEQAAALAAAEERIAGTEAELADAEAAADDAEARADEAEAAAGVAEQAAAPSEDAIEEYLWLLRDGDTVFWGATDDELVEIGLQSCRYMDVHGNGDAAVAELGEIVVEFGLTSFQSAQLTSAAIVMFCPQHSLD